ncbi:unnamed protein product [Closterium sp. NIES-54]
MMPPRPYYRPSAVISLHHPPPAVSSSTCGCPLSSAAVLPCSLLSWCRSSRLLPSAKRVDFQQVVSANPCFEAIVARYSSPSSSTMGSLLTAFLFSDLPPSAPLALLTTLLNTPPPPPMHLTLHFLSTRLHERLALARDALHPMALIIDLFEIRLTEIWRVAAVSAPFGRRGRRSGGWCRGGVGVDGMSRVADFGSASSWGATAGSAGKWGVTVTPRQQQQL